MTDRPLNRNQKSVLDALAVHRETGLTPVGLAERLHRGKEGVAATASSLVRRSLVHRERGERGHVTYKITPVGLTYSPAWQMAQAVRAQRELERTEVES